MFFLPKSSEIGMHCPGFVVSEAFQGDLYLHRRNNSELGPVQAGDPVSFQVPWLLSW